MTEIQAHSPAAVPDTGIRHPYHLVAPSPWPLTASLSAGVLAGGAVMGMHQHGWTVCILGLLGVLATMIVWWRDVIHEAVVEKAHSPVVKIGLRYGMTLFIASEVMFFAAFFWAFFDTSLFFNEAAQVARTAANGGVWPPKGTAAIDPLGLPLIMTMILLLSGTTVTWAHHALVAGRNDQAVRALAATVLLGVMFTSFQAYEYVHAEFGFAENAYTSVFFMATGFHGFHVIVGTIFLVVCFFRARAGHFTPQSHFGFEAAAWYWHFVDVVWLFLFFAIYCWGSVPRGVVTP